MYVYVENSQVVKIINEGISFDLNGVQYPSNWLSRASLEEKNSLGIYEVVETNPPNNRTHNTFSFSIEKINEQWIMVWNYEEKLISDVKNELITSAKRVANEKLSSTDWYVIRKADTNEPIPQHIISVRDSIRQACNDFETAVNSKSLLSELENINPNWPQD